MKIFNKTAPGPAEHVDIMAVREGVIQPFNAGQWLDLRIGFLLSVCGANDGTDDDTITGWGNETITHVATTPPSDYFFIGVKDSSTIFPSQTGSVFIGYTNLYGDGPVTKGDSMLVSSDLAIGTSNSDYWRPKNGNGDDKTFVIWDGQLSVANGVGLNAHLVQNFAGGHAAGYATLLMIRLTRPNSTSTVITTTVKLGSNSSDVLFSSTPTAALLQSNMEAYPSTVRQLGPVTLSAVPDSLFWYWPFHNSRLRVHCAGIEVIAS